MSMATIIAVQDAIKESFQEEEVQRLIGMLSYNRHNPDVTDEMYEDGIGMLVSMVAASTTNQLMPIFVPKDEYDQMVNEYRDFTMMFGENTEEEEEDN
jgi:hypothetical protein